MQPEPASHATAARLSPRTIGPDVVAYFASVFDQYVEADHMLGPAHVRDVVIEQTKQLDAVARSAADPYRSKLLNVLVRYAEFAGWLCQDSGALDDAARWTARAADVAAFIGDTELVAYTAIRRSGIAVDTGRPSDARGFADVGLRHADTLSERFVALGQRQVAQACAAVGDERRCHDAIDAALDAASAAEATETAGSGLLAYCGPAYVQMEAGSSMSTLGEYDGAIDHYQVALMKWPVGQQRDHGLCLARLADAQAAAGRVSEACATGTNATAVLAVAPSVRTRAALQSTRNRLHTRRRSPEVADFFEHLTAVL